MEFWKKAGLVLTAAAVAVVAATYVSTAATDAPGKTIIRMAHAQADGTDIARSIAKFSEYAESIPGSTIEVKIYPSGVLGTEKDTIEMVKAGVLDMAKVGSNTMAQFADGYSVFSLPYLFTGEEHYYRAMEQSQEVRKLFESTYDEGYIAIGYYANGSRNFYIKEDRPVDSPAALKGKKIRSTTSSTSMEMIQRMGGSPVPMSAGETYTALQQGIVDGAENTELALTVDGHQDLVKSYTYTEHQYSPDIYIISVKTWEKLTPEQQADLRQALNMTNDNFKKLYRSMMDEAVAEMQEHGVHVYKNIDKSVFIKALAPMHADFCNKGPQYKALFEDIQKYAEAK